MLAAVVNNKVDLSVLCCNMHAMEDTMYPAEKTIKAFGGTSKMAAALNLHKQNIHRWKTATSGYIPRWWSDKIEAVASRDGIKLPRPRRYR